MIYNKRLHTALPFLLKKSKKAFAFLWNLIPPTGDESQKIDTETDDYLRMAQVMKSEREEIEAAKKALSELENITDLNPDSIQDLKDQIAKKENYLNKDFYSDLKRLNDPE
ncbi:MAG: hypothetical protein ABI036_07360 [Fibrobacteria bacterium]